MNDSRQYEFAVTGNINIGLSTFIKGYLCPTGQFRYALTYVSSLLGYSENYLSNFLKPLNPKVSKKASEKLKALLCNGFQGEIKAYLVNREDKRGASVAKTISFDDFCLFVEHEALVVENPKAIALLTASFREMLRSRTQEAFGLPQDTHQERVSFFEANYEEQQRILAENREEVEELKLYGEDDIDGRDEWTRLTERFEEIDFDQYLRDLEYNPPSLEL